MGDHVCTSYLVTRLILGTTDLLSDLLLAIHLVALGESAWAGAVLAWVALAVAASMLSVVVGRMRNGSPMSCTKFLLLSLRTHVELGQALLQAAPSLVTQLVMLWSGVTLRDAGSLAGPPSWDWARAWGEIFSLLLSFSSLLCTATKYNAEPSPALRIALSTLASSLTCLYRVLVLSILLKLAPLLSCLLLLLLYTTYVCLLACWGDSVPQALCHSACGLLIPMGHGLPGSQGLVGVSGVPEAERSRINHEEVVRRVARSFTLHTLVSLLLLVPYFCFLELFLHTSPSHYSSSPLLLSRPLTHSAPPLLLLLSLLSSLLFYREVRRSRSAAKAWDALASPRPSSPPSSSPLASLVPPSSPSRPMRPGDILSAHISRGGEPPSPAPLPALLYPPLPSAPPDPEPSLLPLPPGNRKCRHHDCVTCAFLQEGTSFSSTVTGRQYRLMTPVTCTDMDLIYLVTCSMCRKQYVGKTAQTLRQRHYGHRREIETLSSPLGRHFGEGCGYESWQLQIIDRVEPGARAGELGRRESHWQHELGTLGSKGLNSREERGGGDTRT